MITRTNRQQINSALKLATSGKHVVFLNNYRWKSFNWDIALNIARGITPCPYADHIRKILIFDEGSIKFDNAREPTDNDRPETIVVFARNNEIPSHMRNKWIDSGFAVMAG